jgi:murein DD-endopeptidase MepM/ murein hydrolase activator NlpD
MAKAQYPIDGAQGKTWKVSSKMGWRMHPVKKEKKHHNGTDIFGLGKGPTYIESFYDGKVLKAAVSTAPGGGFGNYVVVQHKIGKDFYTSLYAHLKPGSMKVKAGQKIEAGTVLGIMGTSGMSTGVHLHWEIWKGKEHGWSADGKGFVEPLAFVDALIKMEAAKGFANVATPEDAPVEIIKDATVAVPATKPAPKPATNVLTKPVLKGTLKKGSKNGLVRYLQNSLGVVGDTPGTFGDKTHLAVVDLQKKNKLTADGIVGPLTWGKIK